MVPGGGRRGSCLAVGLGVRAEGTRHRGLLLGGDRRRSASLASSRARWRAREVLSARWYSLRRFLAAPNEGGYWGSQFAQLEIFYLRSPASACPFAGCRNRHRMPPFVELEGHFPDRTASSRNPASHQSGQDQPCSGASSHQPRLSGLWFVSQGRALRQTRRRLRAGSIHRANYTRKAGRVIPAG